MKTKLKTIKPISKRAFDKMTPAQKRVALAKDVLSRLRAKTILERHGEYLVPESMELHNMIARGRFDDDGWGCPTDAKAKRLANSDAQKFVERNRCEVCAKGSIVLSWAANFNNLKMRDIYQADWIDALEGIFPMGIFDAMEEAFEGNRKTLKEVMENLIKNKGNFRHDRRLYTDKNS